MPLPNLADHRGLKLTALSVLYSAQGIPWGLFTIGIPSWLASRGFPAADIAVFVAVATAPWSFKLIAGPLMDRWGFLAMGRRRPWVLAAQSGILLSLALLGTVPEAELTPAEQIPDALWYLAALGFLINSFCAVQDVAVDGMAIDILNQDERARANAFMFGGQVLGISLGSSVGGNALATWGISSVAVLGASATLLIMCFPLLFRERAGERLLPWTAGAATARSLDLQSRRFKPLLVNLTRVLLVPMSLLLIGIEFLNRAANGIVATYLPVYWVQELNGSNIDFNNYVALAGLVSVAAGLLVSPFVDRLGPRRFLPAVAALKLCLFAAFGLFGATRPEVVVGLIFANSIVSQVFTIAVIALFMHLCNARIAASQFAVYMALSNISLTAGTLLLAPLSETLDPSGIFFAGASLYVLLLLLWPRFQLRPAPDPIEASSD